MSKSGTSRYLRLQRQMRKQSRAKEKVHKEYLKLNPGILQRMKNSVMLKIASLGCVLSTMGCMSAPLPVPATQMLPPQPPAILLQPSPNPPEGFASYQESLKSHLVKPTETQTK